MIPAMGNGKCTSNDAASAVARQWAILQALPRAPKKITTQAIEARLQAQGHMVSRRTIERDLLSLSTRFPLLADERSKPYGWSWTRDSPGEILPRLDTPQAVALLLAREHLRNLLPLSLQAELQPMFDLAGRALVGSGWKDWHQRTAVLPTGLSLRPPAIATGVMDCVEQAIARQRCIVAQYRSKGSREARKMRIHPLGLIARGPVMYLICTLFDYDDIRQLALHRLSEPLETTDPCEAPPGFDFQAYARGVAPGYRSRGPVRLVVRIDAPAAEHLNETPLSDDQQVRELDDGQVEVTATVEDDQTLRWWLLAFGDQLEVSSPFHLREEVGKELATAANRYRTGGGND